MRSLSQLITARRNEAHSRHTPEKVRNIWYVDATNGQLAYEGNIPTRPLSTISAAINVAAAGDLIKIAEDTYNEAVSIPAGLAGLEIICEPGVIITNTTPGTVVSIAAPYVRWKGGRIAQAGQVGFDITGEHFFGEDILVDGNTVAFDIGAAHCVLLRCRGVDYTTTCFDIAEPDAYLEKCVGYGTPATRGFYLSHTNAHSCLLFQCHSLNNSAGGYELVAGADENVIAFCTQSELCGGPTDAGANNSWVHHNEESQIAVANTTQQDLADIHTDTSTLPRAEFHHDWMCDPEDTIPSLAITNVAGDLALPSVTFPTGFLPTGAVVSKIVMLFKWRKMIDTSGAPNAINGAGLSWRVKKSSGAWGTDDIEAMILANNDWETAASGTEGGDMYIGTIDLKGEVDDVDNETYDFRGDQTNRGDAPVVDGNALTLYGVQTGLRVFFTLS